MTEDGETVRDSAHSYQTSRTPHHANSSPQTPHRDEGSYLPSLSHAPPPLLKASLSLQHSSPAELNWLDDTSVGHQQGFWMQVMCSTQAPTTRQSLPPGATPSSVLLWLLSPGSGTSVCSSSMAPEGAKHCLQWLRMVTQSASEKADRKCFINRASTCEVWQAVQQAVQQATEQTVHQTAQQH